MQLWIKLFVLFYCGFLEIRSSFQLQMKIAMLILDIKFEIFYLLRYIELVFLVKILAIFHRRTLSINEKFLKYFETGRQPA